ncbi:MAG: hypothetical protein FWD61_17250 [Phycisphaerales bacterium]|nr:hypothetical protein [Phycisphaerales bacterium]
MNTDLFPVISSIAAMFVVCVASGCAPLSQKRAQFMGLPIEERRVVFILDGDLQGTRSYELLQAHLSQTIQSLDADQSFNVMLVGETLWTAHPQLTLATNDIKHAFARQMTRPQITISIGDRLPFDEAFTKSFSLKPDAIYFLADPWGFYPQLADTVAKLQTEPKIKVHTLAFLEYRTLTPFHEKFMDEFAQQMKSLAESTGGNFKCATQKDFGVEGK